MKLHCPPTARNCHSSAPAPPCPAASHYDDVIMTTTAAQITSLTVVYSTVYSDANQRNHQSSASLAFVWGIHRDRWIPRTKGQLRGKCFHLMTSSWLLDKNRRRSNTGKWTHRQGDTTQKTSSVITGNATTLCFNKLQTSYLRAFG